jgi:4-hydroxybenzoate polyprenyltransferase
VRGRWIDQSQPQTLQGAVLFSYLNAALALIFTLILGESPFLLVFILLAAAAFGIANERRIAYWAGVVLASAYLLGVLALMVAGGGFGEILNLLFAGVLVALLLHPESRHYERIWFK